jgi:chaperonin GroEL (HSP60 family)
MVREEKKEKTEIEMENIKLEKKQGGGIEDTELIKGVVIDKEVVHAGMPKEVSNAKIALIDSALEVKEPETDTEVRISSPEQLEALIGKEEKELREMVETIAKVGANVVFCQKGIDDLAQHYLAKKGIAAARRVKKSDMEALARATGARIVSRIDDLAKEDLGWAKLVKETKIAGEEMIFVRDCHNPKAVSILIRGGTEHVVDEAERAMKDAIGGTIATIKDGLAVAGGGASEMELCQKLQSFAKGFTGREQLAIQAFAEAMESIPRALAENAGLDPIDMLIDLRASHGEGKKDAGLDVFKGKAIDMWKAGVIEPIKIKTQAIKSASEAAEMVLRIDDVVAAGKLSEGAPGGGTPPGGPPGGMPEM